MVGREPTQLQAWTHTSRTSGWNWEQGFGPNFGDVHKWSVARSGDAMSIGHDRTSLNMDLPCATRLLEALQAALRVPAGPKEGDDVR
jgi:hypothetical protein